MGYWHGGRRRRSSLEWAAAAAACRTFFHPSFLLVAGRFKHPGSPIHYHLFWDPIHYRYKSQGVKSHGSLIFVALPTANPFISLRNVKHRRRLRRRHRSLKRRKAAPSPLAHFQGPVRSVFVDSCEICCSRLLP